MNPKLTATTHFWKAMGCILMVREEQTERRECWPQAREPNPRWPPMLRLQIDIPAKVNGLIRQQRPGPQHHHEPQHQTATRSANSSRKQGMTPTGAEAILVRAPSGFELTSKPKRADCLSLRNRTRHGNPRGLSPILSSPYAPLRSRGIPHERISSQ